VTGLLWEGSYIESRFWSVIVERVSENGSGSHKRYNLFILVCLESSVWFCSLVLRWLGEGFYIKARLGVIVEQG
jgi:hypothetical protein